MARYKAEVTAWGHTITPGGMASEMFEGMPTEEQLKDAQIVTVKFTDLDNPKHTRFATIRVPFGFGGFEPTALDDLQRYIEESADRYDFELVSNVP